MAAVARLTRNLSQERATILAKEAIELSTAGNVEVRDTSSFCLYFTCHCGFCAGVDKPLDDLTRHNTRLIFSKRRSHSTSPQDCMLTFCVRKQLANSVKLLLSVMTIQTSRLLS
jgi:hypothetical protein